MPEVDAVERDNPPRDLFGSLADKQTATTVDRRAVLRSVEGQAAVVRRWLAGETLKEIGVSFGYKSGTGMHGVVVKFVESQMTSDELSRWKNYHCSYWQPHSTNAAAALERWAGRPAQIKINDGSSWENEPEAEEEEEGPTPTLLRGAALIEKLYRRRDAA